MQYLATRWLTISLVSQDLEYAIMWQPGSIPAPVSTSRELYSDGELALIGFSSYNLAFTHLCHSGTSHFNEAHNTLTSDSL